jgi:secretion/DNA translocation related CpaE-like protein
MTQPVPAGDRPLVITSDERILDDLLRLCAVAGAEADVVPDAGAARPRWSAAPVVVVGSDQAEPLVAAAPPRRPGVLLVGGDVHSATTWRLAVGIGAERVVGLPAEESVVIDALADAVDGTGGQALVVGAVGGRGGAGASVLATGLAVTGGRQGRTTMLIDADPYGGGLDLMLGAEHSGGLRWPDLADTRGRVGGATLREHLPEPHGLTVLSWDRGDVLGVPADAVRAVVLAARRAWDLVVVDFPRRMDAATEEALACCACVLLVVPAEVRAVAAASRVATAIGMIVGDVRTVVRGPSPSGLRGADVAAALHLPLAAELTAEPGLVAALERGEPPARTGRGSLSEACERLLADLGGPDWARAA